MMDCQAVIFDFGQVLVRFDPETMIAPYFQGSSEDVSLLCAVLFDRKYWDRLDAGTVTHEEILRDVRLRVPPRLFDVCPAVLDNWQKHLPEIDGMRALLEKLKKAGRKLYLLSNISRHFSAHSSDVPILSFFDGCVFSAEAGAVKPTPEIFSLLCGRFGIDKERAVFIDDNEKNVAGARAFGINSLLFDGDASHAELWLKSRGIL